MDEKNRRVIAGGGLGPNGRQCGTIESKYFSSIRTNSQKGQGIMKKFHLSLLAFLLMLSRGRLGGRVEDRFSVR
jgi:hypothetical protein